MYQGYYRYSSSIGYGVAVYSRPLFFMYFLDVTVFRERCPNNTVGYFRREVRDSNAPLAHSRDFDLHLEEFSVVMEKFYLSVCCAEDGMHTLAVGEIYVHASSQPVCLYHMYVMFWLL